jgi:hypothetical protein
MKSEEISAYPTFFLVGAPRCGTSAMSKYLSKHPSVCFSKPKEPHFFTLLHDLLDNPDIERDYLQRFFFHKTPEHTAVGEGSVSYLYSEDAIKRILNLNPQAKFIVIVRNPVDMIYSYHARMLKFLEEDQQDFRVAWQLQEARSQGLQLPKDCQYPHMLQYKEVGSVGSHVQKLINRVGRDRVHVVVFDDFVSDTLQAYKNVLAFLDLEYDGRTDFPRKGENEAIKYKFLQRILKRPPKRLANFMLTLQQHKKRRKQVKKSWIERYRKRLVKKNQVRKKRPPLDSETRRLLAETFTDDVNILQTLLNRDFSHWLQ